MQCQDETFLGTRALMVKTENCCMFLWMSFRQSSVRRFVNKRSDEKLMSSESNEMVRFYSNYLIIKTIFNKCYIFKPAKKAGDFLHFRISLSIIKLIKYLR